MKSVYYVGLSNNFHKEIFFMVDLIKTPDEKIIEQYSYGQCMYLATALHRKYNFEIQCIMESDDVGEYLHHAWVVDTDGMMIDIVGKFPSNKNDFVNDLSKVIGKLNESDLLAIIRKYSDIKDDAWNICIKEAEDLISEYFA